MAVVRLAAVVLSMQAAVQGAELQPRTVRAFEEYLEKARRGFIARASGAIDVTPGAPVTAGPAGEDGIIGVPDGLIHHWKGSAFIRGVDLGQALAASRDYASYPTVYHNVKAVRLIETAGDRSQVVMRLYESAGGFSATLEVRSTIDYTRPRPDRVQPIAVLEEIREVKNPGTASEQLLPPGRDSGFLWRGATFTVLVEQAGGVYLEMETVALSRAFPPMLGWIIEPIARRVGRRSVETSLREFEAGVRKAVKPSADRRSEHYPSVVRRVR
jgi:hypothetical protein